MPTCPDCGYQDGNPPLAREVVDIPPLENIKHNYPLVICVNCRNVYFPTGLLTDEQFFGQEWENES